jgi:hypothetical protein
MSAITQVGFGDLTLAQATQLALLVEAEARWENLRKTASQPQEPKGALETLLGLQKAYEAFRGRLVTYNRKYTPAHVPELLLNTPPRLARWCRQMEALFLSVEHAPQAPCPLHLLEKAYRRAEGMSARMDAAGVRRSVPPLTMGTAVAELGALARWSEALAAA